MKIMCLEYISEWSSSSSADEKPDLSLSETNQQPSHRNLKQIFVPWLLSCYMLIASATDYNSLDLLPLCS